MILKGVLFVARLAARIMTTYQHDAMILMNAMPVTCVPLSYLVEHSHAHLYFHLPLSRSCLTI